MIDRLDSRRPRTLVVRVAPTDRRRGHVELGGMRHPCAIGRGGIKAGKREGDGGTPIGTYPVRSVLFRADKVARPATMLPVAAIRRDDGWCDAVGDRNYNRRVRHPYPASAERLWRDDNVYDIIVVLGINDLPRRRGRGSAVFMHLARPGMTPTEGCIALGEPDLRRVLAGLRRGDRIAILG